MLDAYHMTDFILSIRTKLLQTGWLLNVYLFKRNQIQQKWMKIKEKYLFV